MSVYAGDDSFSVYSEPDEEYYAYGYTEEERAKREAQKREKLASLEEVKAEVKRLSELGELNKFFRKNGLVIYRCPRGCLLGSVFNHKGVRYWYGWNGPRLEPGSKQRPMFGLVEVRPFEAELRGEEVGDRLVNCRHRTTLLTTLNLLRDIESVRTKRDKTIRFEPYYLPKLW